MRVAIPVDDDKTIVYSSFGRAPYIAIYDTDTKTKKYINNMAAAVQGGAGIRAAQLVLDQGAQAVLVPKCGQNAAGVFAAANVAMYQAAGGVNESIEAFERGALPPLRDIHAGYHHHGGR